jgi:ubiquinone/menaquinone biosynthesis C-methylase UbiE
METQDVKALYNGTVQDKFSNNYEYERWFSTPIKVAGYDMTWRTILQRIIPLADFKTYLELGPGPGTWTKLFIEHEPQATFDLVDISEKMLGYARQALADSAGKADSPKSSVTFIESDFLDFAPAHEYDFFFSSRVLEYFPDKKSVIAKIYQSLKPTGRGAIITKTPKYLLSRLRGRPMGKMHQQQIAPAALKRLLEEHGFDHVKLYPVTMTFPGLNSAWLNRAVYSVLGALPLNPISVFFSESYCITFSKQ